MPRQKIKKTAARMSLELDPTPDILAELGRKKGDRLLIGFAAETENLIEKRPPQTGIEELRHGGGQPGDQEATGFESDENEVVLVLRTGETIPLPRAPKREIADRIFDQVLKLRLALHAANEPGPTSPTSGVLSGSRRSKRSITPLPHPNVTLPANPQPPIPVVHFPTLDPRRIAAYRSSRTSAIAAAAVCTRRATRLSSARAMSKPGWCSSAKARARTRMRRACRSWAARANCSRR